MVTYTPWVEYGPLWQSAGHTLPVPARYDGTVSGQGDATSISVGRTISPSLAAHSAGYEPPDDAGARRCAQAWAAAGLGGTQSDWDPGECPTITGDPSVVGGPVSGDMYVFNEVAVGTSAHWTVALPFLIHPFDVSVIHSQAGWWISTDIDSLYLGVSRDALAQVDRWVAAVESSPDHDFSTDPQVERTRIDVRAQLVCTDPQTEVTHSFVVSGHPRDRVVGGTSRVTPYLSLAGEAFSASASPGSSSAELTWGDVAPGEGQYYDLASSRVLGNEDPGTTPFRQTEANIGHMRWVVDVAWSFRIRYPLFEEPPLRWRQRNDGRGVGAAHRHKTGTSIQASHRHRGGYR